MTKIEKFYNEVIKLLNHCQEQYFIKESEIEYLMCEITKIKNDIESE